MQKIVLSGFLLLAYMITSNPENAKRVFQADTGISWTSEIHPNKTASLIFTGLDCEKFEVDYYPDFREIYIRGFLSDGRFHSMKLKLWEDSKFKDTVSVDIYSAPKITRTASEKVTSQKYCQDYYYIDGKVDISAFTQDEKVMKYNRKAKKLEITVPYEPCPEKITEVCKKITVQTVN